MSDATDGSSGKSPEPGPAKPAAGTSPEGQSAPATRNEPDAGSSSSTEGASLSTPGASEEASPPPSVLQLLAPHLAEERLAARRKDKMRGLLIIGVTFVLCILLSLWGKERAEPELSEPPRPPTTQGVVGWPKQVEAVATLPVARAVTRRANLRGFVAEAVKRDGTIDFKKRGALVRYAFHSGPGEGPQPQLEPGTVPRRSYCGRQSVYIRRHGLVGDADMPGFPCGITLKQPLSDPQCSLKQVWDRAIEEKNVPSNKAARIEYYESKAGPAYRFTLPGTQHRIALSGDCSRVLTTAEALGGVP